MKTLENVTNFLLALGTVLTAVSAVYKQYNEGNEKKTVKLNDCAQV